MLSDVCVAEIISKIVVIKNYRDRTVLSMNCDCDAVMHLIFQSDK